MGQKLSIKKLELQGKKALIRVDFNVPMENGQITDDTRIRAALPTIQYALDQGAAVILLSHLGRPKGPSPELSLAPCAKRLSELLKRPVEMAPNCHGQAVAEKAAALKPGQLLMLENLRFHPGEEHPEQEPDFVAGLADLRDVYIDDAFGCAHRPHASIVPITTFFPGKAAAGLLLEKEIAYLGATLADPKRPFYAILGGSKVSTKFKVIEALMKKADVLLIGGGMAYTFLKVQGFAIGDSLFEPEYEGVAREILDVGQQSRCRIILPTDIVITQKIEKGAPSKVVDVKAGIPPGFEGVDIGPKTILAYDKELQNAATIFWNGPLGVFECPPFDRGTFQIAQTLAESSATTIVGGGDSAAAIEMAGFTDSISHISTGGGAALEYIEFGTLPGIEALSDMPIATLKLV